MKIKRFRTRDSFQLPGSNVTETAIGYKPGDVDAFQLEESARGVVVIYTGTTGKMDADPVMVPWSNVVSVDYDRKDPEMVKVITGDRAKR